MKKHYKAIVISDVHLGTSASKAKELVQFLEQYTCDKLILNGDIIDGWQLKKYGVWKKKHTRLFRTILKMIEQQGTKVIYLRGNHDDFLDQILPIKIGKNFSIQREYILKDKGKSYYIIHGDIFDSITTKLKWLAYLGDIGYTFLLWVNKLYNQYRTQKGLPYYSLSQRIKSKVKSAVSYISDFESELANLAHMKQCDGIICGHIHQPAMKWIGKIQYLNPGDWVESLSALMLSTDGEWSLAYYTETKNSHIHQEEELEMDEWFDTEEETMEQMNLFLKANK